METNNKTVEQACEVLYAYPKAEVCDGSGLTVLNNDKIADRILGAYKRKIAEHKREIAGIVANLDALEKAIEAVCDKETVEKIIAKKKEIQNGNE